MQSAVDRAYHHDLLADGRSGKEFGIDLRAPQLTAAGAIQRNDRSFAAAGHHDAEAGRRTCRDRHLQLFDPNIAARIEGYRKHLTLVARREYQAVVDGRPQAQPQLDLLLAAAYAFAPEFLHRQG